MVRATAPLAARVNVGPCFASTDRGAVRLSMLCVGGEVAEEIMKGLL
jgi:hypothetical protein